MNKSRLLFAVVVLVVLVLSACRKQKAVDLLKPYAASYLVHGTYSYTLPNTGYHSYAVANDTVIITDSSSKLYINCSSPYLNQGLLTGDTTCSTNGVCFAGNQVGYQCYSSLSYVVKFPTPFNDSITVDVTAYGCGLGGGLVTYYSLSGSKF